MSDYFSRQYMTARLSWWCLLSDYNESVCGMTAQNKKWALLAVFHAIGQQADFTVDLLFGLRPFVGIRLFFHHRLHK
jgi:hypothetical protein